MKEQKKILLLFLLSFAYVVLFWRRLLIEGMVPFHLDTICFYYPNWWIGKHLLESGFQFLWDPFRNMGMPFLAVPQNQALYPLRLIGALFSFSDSMKLTIMVHVLLSSSFGYLLAKEWAGDRVAGVVGALGFGFSGLIFMRVVFLADFATVAWMPALLYFLVRRKPVWFGAALAMQWLAGHPPLFLVGLVGLIGVGLSDPDPKSWIRSFFIGSLLAFGLTAVQWIPFLVMLNDSIRPVILNSEEALINSVHPVFIFNGLFRPGVLALFNRGEIFYLSHFHIGIVATILAVLGFWKGGRREKIVLGLACLFFIFSLGRFAPLISDVPLFRVFRYPANWVMLAWVCFILLASTGLMYFKSQKVRAGVLSFFALDLLLFVWPAQHPWGDGGFFESPPPLVSGLSIPQPPHRLYFDERIMRDYSNWDFNRRDTWEIVRSMMLPSYPSTLGVREVGSYHSLTSRRNFSFRERLSVETDQQQRLMNLANVEQVVYLDPALEAGRTPARNDVRVYRNIDPFSRIYVVSSTSPVSNVFEKPGYISFESVGPGRAVVSESYASGWRVTVNGNKQTVTPFEETFLSVELEEGTQTVVFDYRPKTFVIGATVSMLTLTGLLIWGLPRTRFRALVSRVSRRAGF